MLFNTNQVNSKIYNYVNYSHNSNKSPILDSNIDKRIINNNIKYKFIDHPLIYNNHQLIIDLNKKIPINKFTTDDKDYWADIFIKICLLEESLEHLESPEGRSPTLME